VPAAGGAFGAQAAAAPAFGTAVPAAGGAFGAQAAAAPAFGTAVPAASGAFGGAATSSGSAARLSVSIPCILVLRFVFVCKLFPHATLFTSQPTSSLLFFFVYFRVPTFAAFWLFYSSAQTTRRHPRAAHCGLLGSSGA